MTSIGDGVVVTTSSTGTTRYVVPCETCGISSPPLPYWMADLWRGGLICFDWESMTPEELRATLEGIAEEERKD